MDNLGKATVRVKILDGLPGIDKDATKFNFDVSAFNWNVFQRSSWFPPELVDCVSDEMESFAACFPSKRKDYVDNYMLTNTGSVQIPTNIDINEDTYILFRATSTLSGYPKDVFTQQNSQTNVYLFDQYQLLQPGQYETASSSYIGPKWKWAEKTDIAAPNDLITLKKWFDWIGVSQNFPPPPSPAAQSTLITPLLFYINQQVVRDGLWWAVESEEFLQENMPFWVNLNIARTPSTNKCETMFMISLGLADVNQSYDICIRQNSKPIIYDYYKGRPAYDEYVANQNSGQNQTVSAPPALTKEFDVDLSRVLDSQDEIEIGVMTIAGRLVVFVNQIPLVYNRIDTTQGGEDNGTFREAKIAKGAIRIYGSNVTATINVCPMTFSPLGILALPIPGTFKENNVTRNIVYHGVKYNGDIDGPVCALPTQPDAIQQKYGVDCYKFIGQGGNAFPSGVGFHKQGLIFFDKSGQWVNADQLAGSDFYILVMESVHTSLAGRNQGVTVYYGGCPYFFHLKGAAARPIKREPPLFTITEDVISVSESASAPDSFHALATATVDLYNKGGTYDYLRYKQYGITIEWGWSNGSSSDLRKTFTGVITSVNTTEEPGREIISLQCEDYMTVLKNTPIINSPFYDGMVGYYAIADIAGRGGIKNFIKDWQNGDEYFLPSGYAFSKPAMRFPSENKLFDCMISIVKRFEAFVYFDGEGNLHINRLPGGLFSDSTNGNFVASFTRSPDANPEQVILSGKNIEYSFSSTVNKINILTLDRDTRNPILYNHSAQGGDDNLLFRKIYMMNQAALGDLPTAKTYAYRLGQRMFFPIRKTSFSTVGSVKAAILEIFNFVKVDKQEYRLTSVAKKYSADSNDFTCEYGMEWLGGA